ncbi:MAG: HDOD domain-containing protein [Planctomycetota bacterium]|nr:HDOD domain-containing protein [Planctomycetota bacterium]
MTSSKIRELLPSGFSIPTLPEVVVRLQRLISEPDVGSREIGEEIAGDAPLLAKVLKMANSAFYGLSGRCLSAEHACTVLGSRVINNIVTQLGALQAYEHLDEVEDVRRIWEHSQAVSELSAFLARRVTYGCALDASDCATFGLLHDLGKVVLVDAYGDEYVQVLRRAREEGSDLVELERVAFEVDHAEVGTYVVSRWGLPEAVCRAVSFHHGPLTDVTNDPAVAIVFLANALMDAAPGASDEELLAILEGPAVASLGLEEDLAAEVIAFVRGRVEHRKAS